MDNLGSHDWNILVPITSGVIWNVAVRLGGLDRLLHIVTRGWRKPNNSSKLLRESGYCNLTYVLDTDDVYITTDSTGKMPTAKLRKIHKKLNYIKHTLAAAILTESTRRRSF